MPDASASSGQDSRRTPPPHDPSPQQPPQAQQEQQAVQATTPSPSVSQDGEDGGIIITPPSAASLPSPPKLPSDDASSARPWYKHPLILRAAERLAYAKIMVLVGGALLYADARLRDDVIKRRLWRRRRRRRNKEDDDNGIFRGLGRHLVLAMSVTLKACAGVALLLALLTTVIALLPGLELRLRVFTAKLPGSGFAHDDTDYEAYHSRLFKQFSYTALVLMAPTAIVLLGTWISAATFEAKMVIDRIVGRLLFEAARRVLGGSTNGEQIAAATAGTPPLSSQKAAESADAARSPPWKRYMAFHALQGLIVGGFVYLVAYSPFERELKKLRTVRECPSTACVSKLWNFRDWPLPPS